jgi:hypothetical protein
MNIGFWVVLIGLADLLTGIISIYTAWTFLVQPWLKFRKEKKRGFYIDIHKFSKTGKYEGKSPNISLNDTAKWVRKEVFGIYPPETTQTRIEKKVKENINKNTDKILDIMLSDKNIQKQMQKQIFQQLKKELGGQLVQKTDKKVR